VTDEEKDVARATLVRDHLANERTYLAWLRTTASVIVLGLAIAKFVESAVGRRKIVKDNDNLWQATSHVTRHLTIDRPGRHIPRPRTPRSMRAPTRSSASSCRVSS
jgi:Domain of unknown function (DUF202)